MNKKGIAIIVAYSILVVLLIVSGSFMYQAMNQNRLLGISKSSKGARGNAEQGLAYAIKELYYYPNFITHRVNTASSDAIVKISPALSVTPKIASTSFISDSLSEYDGCYTNAGLADSYGFRVKIYKRPDPSTGKETENIIIVSQGFSGGAEHYLGMFVSRKSLYEWFMFLNAGTLFGSGHYIYGNKTGKIWINGDLYFTSPKLYDVAELSIAGNLRNYSEQYTLPSTLDAVSGAGAGLAPGVMRFDTVVGGVPKTIFGYAPPEFDVGGNITNTSAVYPWTGTGVYSIYPAYASNPIVNSTMTPVSAHFYYPEGASSQLYFTNEEGKTTSIKLPTDLSSWNWSLFSSTTPGSVGWQYYDRDEVDNPATPTVDERIKTAGICSDKWCTNDKFWSERIYNYSGWSFSRAEWFNAYNGVSDPGEYINKYLVNYGSVTTESVKYLNTEKQFSAWNDWVDDQKIDKFDSDSPTLDSILKIQQGTDTITDITYYVDLAKNDGIYIHPNDNTSDYDELVAEGCVVDTQFYNNYYAVVDKKIATTSADDVVFPDPAIKIDIGCIRNSTAYSGMNYIYVEPVTRTVNGQDYTNAETTDTKELQVSTLVVNAERIMDGGLTLISPQRVYLKGDINTYRVGTTEEGWQPTSLISNSIAFSLSDNFQDYGEIRNSPASTCSSGDFGDADCDGPQHLPGLYHGTETYPNPLEYPYNQSTTSLYPGMLNPKANAGGTVDQYISLVSPHSSTYFNIEIGTNVNLHGSIIQIPYNYNGWTNKSSSLSTYYHSRLSQGAPTIAWANKLQTYYDTNLVDTKPPGDFTGSSGRAWLNLEEADFNTNRKF